MSSIKSISYSNNTIIDPQNRTSRWLLELIVKCEMMGQELELEKNTRQKLLEAPTKIGV